MDLSGDAFSLSTPKGLNDFYQLWLLGQDTLAADWASWQMPSKVNPFIPEADIEQARRELPRAGVRAGVRRQVPGGRGSWSCSPGGGRAPPHSYTTTRGHSYVMGVDWARDLDFTVLSIIDASTREQVAMDRYNQVDWEFQPSVCSGGPKPTHHG